MRSLFTGNGHLHLLLPATGTVHQPPPEFVPTGKCLSFISPDLYDPGSIPGVVLVSPFDTNRASMVSPAGGPFLVLLYFFLLIDGLRATGINPRMARLKGNPTTERPTDSLQIR